MANRLRREYAHEIDAGRISITMVPLYRELGLNTCPAGKKR